MTGVWCSRARVRGAEAAAAVVAILEDLAGAVSAFEAGPEEWRVEAWPATSVLSPTIVAQMAVAAAATAGALLDISEEKLPARDWLAENQLDFPPMRVGRFFIRGSHHRGRVPAGTVVITIDAATAFGTGEHPSTRGCLLALEELARHRRVRRPLDIGAGTGILSIAAAKLMRRRVLARDIDRNAVAVARQNIACNGVAGLVRVGQAAGYRDRALGKSRYDLVLSNILARPLALMARDLSRVLAPAGRAVLSGLLRRQEPIVLAPHRGLGMVLERRFVLDGWSTLVLRTRNRPR
jgi:ribosomal protein L11 methyltransferase